MFLNLTIDNVLGISNEIELFIELSVTPHLFNSVPLYVIGFVVSNIV